MSAFKRYQSKVYWDQMASRDLESDCFLRENEPPNYYFEHTHEEEEQEDSAGKLENVTPDEENITVILVCKSDEDIKQEACQVSMKYNEDITHRRMKLQVMDEEKENSIILGNISSNHMSQDLKSQDSGFSDSERSDCSETYENAIPRRKLRRKKIKQRRIAPLWLEEDSFRGPTCTSTPKNFKLSTQNRLEKPPRDSHRRQKSNEEYEDTPTLSLNISLEDESLGDFLYAIEPPEDSVQSVITKSSISTDSSNTISDGRDVLNSRNYRQSAPMRVWLTDLAMKTENECESTLQSKNLPRRRVLVLPGEIQARDLRMLSSAATAAASKLLVNAEQFRQHYRNTVEKIMHLGGGRFEMELLRSIEEAAFSILSELGAPPPRRIQQNSLKSILTQLQRMKTYVDSTIDTRLDFYIEKIIRALEETPSENNDVARGALAALTALSLSDPRAASSIARCSGIRILLTHLVTANRSSDDFIAITLRALASICCSATAIEYFAKDSGPEILTDFLAAEFSSEKEKMEATALLVQITAPWTNALGLPYLEPFSSSLIPALNRLVESTDCGQTLLLAAAALNYLSKSRLCAEIILTEDTVKKLLRSVKKSVGGNVWLMEQVAALIGELARTPEGRSHLAKARASVALVSFLRMRPLGLENAYRRLEITASAALTRLCVESEIARQVVAVGGGDCLPACRFNEIQTEDEPHIEVGLLRYTKSLRRACIKAARQIGIAKAKDHSTLD